MTKNSETLIDNIIINKEGVKATCGNFATLISVSAIVMEDLLGEVFVDAESTKIVRDFNL